MRHQMIAIALAGGLSLPVASDSPPLGTHAIRGVVKSVSPTSLVITRSRGRRRDMMFVMSSSTDREGSLAAGTPVSIRYVMQGKVLIATAVAVESRPCESLRR